MWTHLVFFLNLRIRKRWTLRFSHLHWRLLNFTIKPCAVFLHSAYTLSGLFLLPRSACFWMLLACKAKAFGIYWKIKIGLNLFLFTCCSQDENTQESNLELPRTFYFFNSRKLLYLMKVCELNFRPMRELLSFR